MKSCSALLSIFLCLSIALVQFSLVQFSLVQLAHSAPIENSPGDPPQGEVAIASPSQGETVASLTAAAPAQTLAAAPAQPKGPLATTEGDYPGITADIIELKRTAGETVTLKFQLLNNSSEGLDFGYNFAEGGTSDYANIGGVHLIDAKNKKKYFVVRDSAGKCLCSNALKSLAAGQKMTLWAKFPAPPADVSTLTVEIPHFIPAEEIPLS